MIDPLQEFEFTESNYERPNHEWQCGWASQGEPCHIGPNGSGICQAHRECVPYKDGDRYKCARPQNFGGTCGLGPRPDGACSQRMVECQPVRTLRGRRTLFTFTLSALALGACLIMFGGLWGNSYSSPGELTLQHHSARQKCNNCHAAASVSFASWVGSFAAAKPAGHDSAKCLECHKLGPNPLMAHGVERNKLLSMNKEMSKMDTGGEPLIYSVLETAARNPLDEEKGLACALCHHEHRGQDFDITAMSNLQCQSCHTTKFKSFADGHPEFDGYPYSRRTRIHFDHVTHYRVHFATFQRVKPDAVLPAKLRNYGKETVPSSESCEACHQADSSATMMPIRGFEHTCAACHGAEIEEDSLPGVQLLAVPKIPVAESGTFARLPAIGEWPDLEWPADPQKGEHGVEGYKQNVMWVPPLLDLLLSSEPDYAKARARLKNIEWTSNGTEWPDEMTAEQFAAVQTVAWHIKQLLYELLTEGETAGVRRLNRLKALHKTAEGSASPETDTYAASLSAWLFHNPSLMSALRSSAAVWFPHLKEDVQSWKAGTPAAAGLVEPLDPQKGQMMSGMEEGESQTRTPDDTAPPLSGWYAETPRGILRYRVIGHADRMVRAILNFSGLVPGLLDAEGSDRSISPSAALGRDSMSKLFGTWGDPSAAFRCLGCHTADLESDGRLTINWVGRHVSPDSQSFNRFSHEPHLTLFANGTSADGKDCGYCHVPQKEINFVADEFVRHREGYTANVNPHASVTSGFLPLSKITCANCHTSSFAGDSCLKCHNYHIFD